VLFSGCATEGGPTTGRSEPTSPTAEPRASTRQIDPQQAERLRRAMVPLIRGMNSPKPLDQIQVAIVDDPRINAANAGGGQFYVTTGLLQKASDRQLAGVLAHEVAHDDLGHVAKQQVLQTGLGIGMVILDQVFPGSRAITPLAGTLVARGYGRNEEYSADKHGVTILGRAGDSDPKGTMLDTLTWLTRAEGASGGGWFATHPGTEDRIDAIRKL
jgi:predicted Zn-dependent protease